MEAIVVSTEAGQIHGELRVPTPTKQLIIICHGYQSSRDSLAVSTKVPRLHELGHATFTFDFTPTKDGIDVEGQVRDLRAVIKHFKEFDEFVLIGISFAALATSIVAMQTPKVTRLITLGGFFGRGELGGDYRRKFRLFMTLAMVSPHARRIYRYLKTELKPERITVPVLVIYSKADHVVYPSQSRYFFDHLTAPKQQLELAHANHTATDAEDNRLVVDTIHDWLQQAI